MAGERATQMVRSRFQTFRQLCDELGESVALEKMLERQTEREKVQMGPLIKGRPLADALEAAMPVFEQLGMQMTVVDISNNDKDAVLEIQKRCPYVEPASEFGVDRPCAAACELGIRAVMNAFSGINGRMLSSQADGDCTCVIKYERPADQAR